MKRILAGALAALLTFSAYATTFVPPALINPAGSTSGQVISSTGPTGAAGWATVTPSGIGGLAKASNLSDVASATTALTNLGGLGATTAASTYATIANLALKAPLASPTFTGTATFPAANISAGVFNSVTVGLTTPLAGNFTTLAATSLISPTSTVGIKATATNDTVQAGSVGEPATATVAGVGLTSNTTTNIASLNLAPGDWLVYGLSSVTGAGGALLTNAAGGISTTSATLGAFGTFWQSLATFPINGVATFALPTVHLKLAATTAVFCLATATFTSGTAAGSCVINAIRPR